MGLRIRTNTQSIIAQHKLSESREKMDHIQNKLASGQRIVYAMDDAAGLAISEILRASLRATSQNIKNTQSAFYLLQTADSALNEVTNIAIRMKELAVQAASDTNGDKERGYLDNEYQELKNELNRISESTQFSGRQILSGNDQEIQVQVGPNNDPAVDRIVVKAGFNINTDTLGIESLDVLTADSARDAIDPINFALDTIAKTRGNIGAGESRINATVRSLMQYEENLSGAFSQLRDADMALETAESAKYNILSQAGVSVLAQANSIPAIALKLLE